MNFELLVPATSVVMPWSSVIAPTASVLLTVTAGQRRSPSGPRRSALGSSRSVLKDVRSLRRYARPALLANIPPPACGGIDWAGVLNKASRRDRARPRHIRARAGARAQQVTIRFRILVPT